MRKRRRKRRRWKRWGICYVHTRRWVDSGSECAHAIQVGSGCVGAIGNIQNGTHCSGCSGGRGATLLGGSLYIPLTV